MQSAEARLKEYREQIEPARPAGALPVLPSSDARNGIDTFLALTLRNVMGSLTDLEQLGRALAGQSIPDAHPCQLINCPRGAQLQAAVEETISVLEETKGAFKSKTLGELRHKLELLLKHV